MEKPRRGLRSVRDVAEISDVIGGSIDTIRAGADEDESVFAPRNALGGVGEIMVLGGLGIFEVG